MNKLIQKLAEKAGAHTRSVCHGHGDYRTEFQLTDENIEKFAELLIKECAIIANRADNTETEIRCMYDVITEHFGVK